MNYSFEYIDIILLAMIAGFIFLRLRGILGKKSGFEDKMPTSFPHDFPNKAPKKPLNENTFDEGAQKDFIKGAKIAYENIITSFSSGNIRDVKPLLDSKVLNQFEVALKERKEKGIISETTFIGINSADIKEHSQNSNMLEVTVDFVSEIISCVKDKDKKVLSGDPQRIKKVHDTWKFSRDTRSASPNWFLIDTKV